MTAAFSEAVAASCTDKALCKLRPEEVFTPAKTPSYAAFPLHGIALRAPYLHNGSIPTLRHLLVPSERPATFVRGNIDYDTANVGFEWRKKSGDVRDGTQSVYDTAGYTQGNQGHDSPAYLGNVDWSSRPQELADLLEYLKSL
jgi:hypothetical protein